MKALFRVLNRYERPMGNLLFPNFLKGPENDLTLRIFQIFHKFFVTNYNHLANAIPANTYLFKVNDRNIRKRGEICSKLTKNFKQRVSIVDFKQVNVSWDFVITVSQIN